MISDKNLREWLRPHLALDAADPEARPRYLRLLCGRSQRSASLEAVLKPCTGRPEQEVVQWVVERFGRLPANEHGFLEVVEVGSKGRIDTLRLGVAAGEDGTDDQEGGGEFADLASSLAQGPHALVAVALEAVGRSADRYAADLRAEREHNKDVTMRLIETAANYSGSKAQLDYIERFGLPGQGDDGMAEAIASVLPMLPAVLAGLASGKEKSKLPPDKRADLLIAEAVALPVEVWQDPERQKRLEPLVRRIMGMHEPEQGAA